MDAVKCAHTQRTLQRNKEFFGCVTVSVADAVWCDHKKYKITSCEDKITNFDQKDRKNNQIVSMSIATNSLKVKVIGNKMNYTQFDENVTEFQVEITKFDKEVYVKRAGPMW